MHYTCVLLQRLHAHGLRVKHARNDHRVKTTSATEEQLDSYSQHALLTKLRKHTRWLYKHMCIYIFLHNQEAAVYRKGGTFEEKKGKVAVKTKDKEVKGKVAAADGQGHPKPALTKKR